LDNFEFLHWFEGIVVSGIEQTRKPHPALFKILFDRYQIKPSAAIFIDDNIKNVEAANQLGLPTIHFQSATQLQEELKRRRIIQ
jgi:2-haloacid dehalogenase